MCGRPTEVPNGCGMSFSNYDRIAGTLDRAKGQGLISEYLVSWRGRGGRLKPKVTVWRDAGATPGTLRDKLAKSLFGLVPPTHILVVDDQLQPD